MRYQIDVNTDWHDSIEVINKYELERFFLCRAFSISQIYRPSENPIIKIVCLSPKLSCKLQVFKEKDNILFEEVVQFSRNGLALIKLDPLPIGKYSIKALLGDRILTKTTQFEVQEYKRSLLHAEVETIKREDSGKTEITLECKEFTGELFSGKVKLTLNSVEIDAKFENGKISFSIIENRLGTYAFPISLTDERGNTVELAVNLFGNGLMHDLLLNNFGTQYKATTTYTEGAKEVLGFYVLEESHEYQDWEIHKKDFNLISPIVDRENPFAEIEYLGESEKYKRIEIHVINLLENTDSKKFLFENPKPGTSISFPITPPISIFNIRAYFTKPGKEPMLLHGVILFSEKINVVLESIESIEPNEILKVKILPSTPCDIFVLAKPKITKTNYPHEEMQSGYLKFIQQGSYFASWILGRKEIKESWIRKRADQFFDFLDSIPPIVFKILFFPIWILALVFGFISKRRRLREEELAAQQVMMREAALRVVMEGGIATQLGGGGDELDLDAKISQEMEDSFPALKDKIRNLNQSVIHTSIHEIEGEITIEVNGITDTGLIELYVFAVSGFTFTHQKKEILSKKENYTIAEFPPLVSEIKGASEASIQTITNEEELILKVEKEKILLEEKTKHKQIHILPLFEAGEYKVDLLKDKKILDRFQTNTSWIHESKILKSRLHTLKQGESLVGENLWVYPSYADLSLDMVNALYEYPHGCAEQTFAGLYGNGMLYLKMESGEFPESKEFNRKGLKQRILSGQFKIQNYQSQYFREYIWGLFDECSASLPISAQCLLHLRPFYKTKISSLFPKLESITEKTKEKLLQENYRDNRLLPFDLKFKEEKIESPESAAALILLDKDPKEAMSYLEKTKQENGVDIYWMGQSLAGITQTTILVARALYKINFPLFSRAWLWICNRLEGNRFYSTSDTAEFLSLLYSLKKMGNSIAWVDENKIESHSLSKLISAKKIEVLEGELLVKEDWTQSVDYRKLNSNLPITIQNLPKEIKFLSEVKLEIEVEEKQARCLVARISTSGKLIFPNGSAQVVTSELPLRKGKVSFTLQAMSKGLCEIQVVVYDLYNPDLIGTSLGNVVNII